MESSPGYETPEKIRFVGPIKDALIIEGIKFSFENSRATFPLEVEKTPTREQQIVGIKSALFKFAIEHLGIDISKKMPDSKKFHFIKDKDFQIVRDKYDLNPATLAVTFMNDETFLTEEQLLENTLGNLQHELMHLVSYRELNIRENNGIIKQEKSRSGYANEKNKVLMIIDEALSEITNIEVMELYWKNEPNLAETRIENYTKIGYIEQIIVVDELLKKVADESGREYTDVLASLQKGKFLGRMQDLRLLTETVGVTRMKTLSAWTLAMDNISIAQEFGLTDAVDKINKIRNGENVNILERVSPNIRFKPSRR